MKSLVIDIQNGEVAIDAIGFKGPECEKATQVVEEELDRMVKTKKAEYAQRPMHGQQAKQRI